jgi:hypothetical protein
MKKVGMRLAVVAPSKIGQNFSRSTTSSSKSSEIEETYTHPPISLAQLERLPSSGARQTGFQALAQQHGNAAAGQIARSLAVQRQTRRQTPTLEQQMGLVRQWFGEYIDEAAHQFEVNADELAAIIATEVRGELSRGDREGMENATSGAAFGLMQLTRDTWGDVQRGHRSLARYAFESNWRNARINILFGAAALRDKKIALRRMLGEGAQVTDQMAFVAYNGGQGTVRTAYRLAQQSGSRQPQIDYLQPQYLKEAIRQTRIYTYYTRRRGVSVDEAIDLKFREITQYPELANQRLRALRGNRNQQGGTNSQQPASSPPANTTSRPAQSQAAPPNLSAQEERTVTAALREAIAANKSVTEATNAGYFAIRPGPDRPIRRSDRQAVAEWLYIRDTLLPRARLASQPEHAADEGEAALTDAEEQTVMAALRQAVASGKSGIAATDAGYYAIRPDRPISPSDAQAVREWRYIRTEMLPKVRPATLKPTAQAPAAGRPVTTPTTRGEPDALDRLMGFENLTLRYSVEQIGQARDRITQETNATTRDELFLLLQAKVQYRNQRNNASTGWTNIDSRRMGRPIGGVMCNLTSLAMALEALGIGNPDPARFPQYEDYLEHVGRQKHGRRFDRTAQWQSVATEMGANVRDLGSGRLRREWWQSTVLSQLRAGNGVMLSVGGHIVRLQDVTDSGLVIDDPYGQISFNTPKARGWDYSRNNLNNATRESGAGVIGENSQWNWRQVETHPMRWVRSIVRRSRSAAR